MANEPTSRRWLFYALGLTCIAMLIPLDGLLAGFLSLDRLPGDVRRELEAIQQYGQLSVLVITAVLIWRLQPRRTRRLLDLGLAAGVTALAAQVVKHLAGRARPLYDEPLAFVGPFATFDPGNGAEPVTVWSDGYALASMPSSHTAAAVVLSVFLATLYPGLRGFAIVMAVIVGAGRLLFAAHYPSDVLAGAMLGMLVGGSIIRAYGGVRLLDWVWTRWVRPGDEPALPRVLAEEARSV